MEFKVIRSDEGHADAINALMALMDTDPVEGSVEADELEVLSILIEQYEESHFPIDFPDPVGAIRFRMDQQGLSQKDLIPYLGSASRVSEILKYKRPLSLSMIRALNKGLGIPASVLIKNNEAKLPVDVETKWNKFPLKEMHERGYFPSFKGSNKDLKDYAEDLIRDFKEPHGKITASLSPIYLRSTVHQRCGKSMNEHALDIWQFTVKQIATRNPLVTKFSEGSVDIDFMTRVSRVSWSEHGPLLAKELLNQHGIHLITESHYSKTYLDGAAMRDEVGNPIIALTLRHDRLDNFWFTLMHELAHVALHFNNENDVFMDDLEFHDVEEDIVETEADELASNALIDCTSWDKAALNINSDIKDIISFSDEIGVHPSIVAGRLRYEASEFRRFNHLVGHKKVKNLFS